MLTILFGYLILTSQPSRHDFPSGHGAPNATRPGLSDCPLQSRRNRLPESINIAASLVLHGGLINILFRQQRDPALALILLSGWQWDAGQTRYYCLLHKAHHARVPTTPVTKSGHGEVLGQQFGRRCRREDLFTVDSFVFLFLDNIRWLDTVNYDLFITRSFAILI